MRAIFLLFFALCLTHLGWSQTPSPSVLKPGDIVSMTCEEEPSLNKDYTITRDGLIVMAFIGAIPVSGLTEEEAAKKIGEEMVRQRIVAKATVVIKRKGANESLVAIRTSGAVQTPGEVPWSEGIRLADVLKIAVPTSSADLTRIEIVSAKDEKLVIDFTKMAQNDDPNNPLLRAGDRVFVPAMAQRQEVLVLGGVKTPGSYPLESGSTLESLVTRAGGLSSLGDRTRVRVERAGQAARLISLDSIPADFVPMAGDRIVVELRAARDYVYLTGSVSKAGGFDLVEGMTLNRFISENGGVTRSARLDRVTIQRADNGRVQTITYNLEDIRKGLAADPMLKPNDRIHVNNQSSRRNNAALVAGAAVILYFLIGR